MVADLIVFEVLLLLYCLFFAREILIEEGLFFCFRIIFCYCFIGFIVDMDHPVVICPWDCLFGGGCCLYPISSSLALALSFRFLIGILTRIRYHSLKRLQK